MLEKLFESLDEKVFTPDLKNRLEERFQNAVEERAREMISEEVQDKIDFIDKKSEEYSNQCEAEYQEKIDELEDKADDYVKEKEEEMVENVSSYLDRVVKQFVREAEEELCKGVEDAQASAVTEAFSKFAKLAGVEVANIVEAKEEGSPEAQLEDAEAENDKLTNENIKLQRKLREAEENIDDLLKAGYINQVEAEADMTDVQAEKFEKLAEMVPFTRSKSYIKKIKAILESVLDHEVEEEDDEIEEEDDVDTDSKKGVNESVITDVQRWKNFL